MKFESGPESEAKRILVTGGTEGIGRVIAEELTENNNNVVVCARTAERVAEMKSKEKIEAIQFDLANIDQIEALVRQSMEKIGGMDVLILNAAASGIQEREDYTFRVNCIAQEKLVESAAESLRKSNGRVVFITSSQAKNPIEDNLAYGKSKKAVEDWLEDFSSRPENRNIHIFSVNPGPVNTKMHVEAIEHGGDTTKARSIQIKNEGKLRNPEFVGRIISKMSVYGKRFNPESGSYDIPIESNEIVSITDENINFEKQNVKKLKEGKVEHRN